MLNTLVLGSLDLFSNTLSSLRQRDAKKLRRAPPRILIHCEIGPFLVKTVTVAEEFRQSRLLREEVLKENFKEGEELPAIQIDESGLDCDQLIIVEKKTAKVVGTFRLQNSDFSKSLHATRKFDLALHMTPPETILELGSACLHKEYRRGMASALLWRGVAEYMVQSHAMASISAISLGKADARSAALVYRYFEMQKKICHEHGAAVRYDSMVPYLETWRRLFQRELTASEIAEAEALIPFVCRGILKNGGKVISKPALDKRTNQIEFLTMLPREDLNRTQWKKFLAHFAEPLS